MVKAGYKQTEIGVIPEDWNIVPLGEVCLFENGDRGKNYPSKSSFTCSGVPFVNAGHVADGRIEIGKLDYISREAFDRLGNGKVFPGDILFCLRGSLGKFGVVPSGFGDGAIASSLVIIRPKASRMGLKYISCYFKSDICYQMIEKWSGGAAQPNLGAQDLARFSIPIPPSKIEQQAIAKALSDVDELIGSLDKLIDKKRAIKTAAMQQLLTGKQRLPGFDGEWELVSMNQHANLKARIGWQALTTEEYLDSGSHYLVTGTDFVGGRVNWETCHFVDEWRYNQDRNIQLKAGDVLLTKDGTIGKVGYVDEMPAPATLNSGVFVIRPVGGAFKPHFLFYILSSRIFDEFLNKITAGSTITHLYQKDFVTFEFLAPAPVEQQAIATVLSDMDAEIEALEARLEKTKAIKKGMMQELLTGRTRLVMSNKE